MQTVEQATAQIAAIVAEFRAGCGPEGALATLRDEVDDRAYEEANEDGDWQMLLTAIELADEETATDAEWAEALAVALEL